LRGRRHEDARTILVGHYLYTRTDGSWTLDTTLIPAGGGPLAVIEIPVAIDGDTAVVGNPEHGRDRGGAYVFRRADGSWTHRSTLVPGDDERNDGVGSTVSIDGEWCRQAGLDPTSGDHDDWHGQYGDEVALAGDTALPSGLWSPTPQIQDGVESAYLFSRGGGSWSETRALRPPEPGGVLGPAALAEGTALVGSPPDGGIDETGDRGVVYVYRI